ncbi:MAG: PHP domain-containing protein [bacterium]
MASPLDSLAPSVESAAAIDLVRQCDVRGVLHSHTQYGNGAHSLDTMVETAREIGLEYLGISDHYRCSGRDDGLCEDSMARQREEIEMLREKYPDFDILQGVEVDADPDGNLPLDDETLAGFDYVIVSLANGHALDHYKLTDWMIKVAQHPRTTILGKPVGACMLQKPPQPVDMEKVLQTAAVAGIILEIDANPCCDELDWSACHRAQELEVLLSINPNAHRAARLVDYRHGVEFARSAGVRCRNIMNTMSYVELRKYLSRRR